jgi:hypothetical protein
VLFLVALLFAFGSATPLFPILFRAIPGLDRFRVPARAILFAQLAVALLAARGFDWTFAKTGGDRVPLSRRVWPIAAGALVLVTAAVSVAPGVFRDLAHALLPALTGGDAERIAFWDRRIPLADVTVRRSLLMAVALLVPVVLAVWLREKGRFSRRGLGAVVFAILIAESWLAGGRFIRTRSVEDVRRPAPFESTEGRYRILDQADYVSPQSSQWGGIERAGGYDPLIPATWFRYTNLMAKAGAPDPDTRIPAGSLPLDENWNRALLDGLNVRYILSRRELGPHGFGWAETIERKGEPDVIVWENHLRRPRAEVLTAWRSVPGPGAAAEWLDREPAMAVLEGVSGTGGGRPGVATIRRYRPDFVEITVESPDGGLLLLRDGWHPGWTALVNHEPATVLRANLTFRAVIVPPGEAAVVFHYRRPGFDTGLLSTLLAFPLLLLAWMYTANRSR